MRRIFFGLTPFLLFFLVSCSAPNRGVYVEDFDLENPLSTRSPGGNNARGILSMPTETPYEENEIEIFLEGYVHSRLNGRLVPEEEAERRPVAVVLNNHFRALPQSGIAGAEVIYEVLAEGDITRLVGIFQAYVYDIPKIGAVRSARDYFVDFALDYDAIFVHHGGSPTGYERLKNLKVDRLDGMELEGSAFWRDRSYPDWDDVLKNQTRPMEHSSFTGGEKLREAIGKKAYRESLIEGRHFGFLFYTDIPPDDIGYPGAGEASRVTVTFSGNYIRHFIYNPDLQLYFVENRNGPHRDAGQGDELVVRNVLIQLVRTHVIPGDTEGRRMVNTVGEGTGFLVFDGMYYLVRWKKESHTEPTRWYFTDGTEMRLGIGKTWICVFQENGKLEFK